MILALTILARLGLVLTLVPSLLYLFGSMQLGTVKLIMIIGTALWLIAAPLIQRLRQDPA